MWEAVETKTEKIRVVKTKREEEKERSRKKTKREKTEERKKDEDKESGRRVGDLGWRKENGKVRGRSGEVGPRKIP